MKKVILIATVLFTVWVSIIPCFAREVPFTPHPIKPCFRKPHVLMAALLYSAPLTRGAGFTQEDRDRLIRLEINPAPSSGALNPAGRFSLTMNGAL